MCGICAVLVGDEWRSTRVRGQMPNEALFSPGPYPTCSCGRWTRIVQLRKIAAQFQKRSTIAVHPAYLRVLER